MSMIINHNIAALNAYGYIGKTSGALQKSIERLSTGLRINSAADDAAGLAISERMRSQISGVDKALGNIQDGISMMQTAEGALSETHSILQRMRELSVQAANDTLTQEDRGHIQTEITQLRDEVTRIANTTQFNRKKLLNGDAAVISGSSDSGTRAIITGGLRGRDPFSQVTLSEGNYNIKVDTQAGQAQVQKTNLFMIKHKDAVAVDNIDTDLGVQDVSVKDMPVADFDVELGRVGLAGAAATGSYGVPAGKLPKYLKAGATTNLDVNASILFEVTSVGSDSVTVKATANTLTTDGVNGKSSATVTLKEGQWTDLSSALGLGTAGTDDSSVDGAFELQLQAGGASQFAVGNKFVYNATVGKNVEGADRTVSISGLLDEEWPDAWTQKFDIQASKVLGFPPDQQVGGSAKVLFLIDNSGSMGTPISTVRTNINTFISKIKAQGVNDVQIGIGRYLNGLVDQSSYAPTVTEKWVTSDGDIQALLAAAPNGGLVDPYTSIVQAVAAYDMSDIPPGGRHIVLVTDTGKETGTGTLAAAQEALKNAGITLSAVYRNDSTVSAYNATRAADIHALLSTDEGGNLTGMEFSIDGDWGEDMSTQLGTKIGQAARTEIPAPDTPLTQLDGLDELLSSGEERTITMHQGEASASVTLSSGDTIEKLVEKLNTAAAALGMASDGDPFVTYAESANEGRPGTITVRSTVEGSDGKITFSGDAELLSALGFHTEDMKNKTPVTDVDIRFSLDASEVTNKEIHFKNFYLNSETGAVHEGDIILTTNDNGLAASGTAAEFKTTFVSQMAKDGTKLRDLAQFWDASGNFLLEDPQTLTVTQGDGQQASVTLYATDTLSTVAEKLNKAIGTDLGQARYVDKDGRDKFATFVGDRDEIDADNPDSESVRGTLLIRSAVAGAAGRLNFSSSEGILSALGLNTIQEATESRYTVNIADAHDPENVIVKDAKVTGNRLVGALHPNIDVEFDAMSGVTVSWDEGTKAFVSTNGSKTTTLHLADRTTTFQVNVNQGQDMSIHIGDMRAHALGLDKVLVTDRESASRSVTLIDNAIDTVSMQRARIGAYQSRLEHAVGNLTAMSENLTAAESRIRDTDMAKEMMEFTKLQILLQSGNSVLAQANQYPQNVLALVR